MAERRGRLGNLTMLAHLCMFFGGPSHPNDDTMLVEPTKRHFTESRWTVAFVNTTVGVNGCFAPKPMYVGIGLLQVCLASMHQIIRIERSQSRVWHLERDLIASSRVSW